MEDEILEIVEVGEVETIDICVSNDNLFYANDILTHNSGFSEEDPSLDKISEGISLANTADCIFNIWQSDEDKENGYINMGIAKNRFGPNFGSTVLKIDYTTLTLEEEDIQNDTEELADFNKSIKALED
jgi:hypothetical protein